MFIFGADQRRLQAAAGTAAKHDEERAMEAPMPWLKRRSVTVGGLCGTSRADEIYHRPSTLPPPRETFDLTTRWGRMEEMKRKQKEDDEKFRAAAEADFISHVLAVGDAEEESDSDDDDADDVEEEEEEEEENDGEEEEAGGTGPSTSAAVRRSGRISTLEEERKKQKTEDAAAAAAAAAAQTRQKTTTSGCLVVAFSGSEDGQLSLTPAVTRGTAPHGPKYRVLRSAPGDEPGIRWLFEFEELPPDADDDNGGDGGGARLNAEQLIQAVGLGHFRQPLWLGCRAGVSVGSEGAGEGDAGDTAGDGTEDVGATKEEDWRPPAPDWWTKPPSSPCFEMLDIVGFEQEAQLDGETRPALAVSVPSPFDAHAEAFIADDDAGFGAGAGAGAIVQFHSFSAKASRGELESCCETMKAKLRQDVRWRDADAVSHPPLGAFAAVCNGRGEGFHGGVRRVHPSIRPFPCVHSPHSHHMYSHLIL